MQLGKIGQSVSEEFTVYDNNTMNVIDNLDSTSIITYLYNPINNEVSNDINMGFYNLGNGDYRITYIPNMVGNWFLKITNNVYFPIGKSNVTQVFENDFDSITDILIRILGLVQENFYIDNNIYDNDSNLIGSRIRIYSNKDDVGTDNNVISEYIMEAIYDENGNMESYKVVKS